MNSDQSAIYDTFIELLEQPWTAFALRQLDQAKLLTQIIPELEPARTTDQPGTHFLPVLAHLLETVAALDWLLYEILVPPPDRPGSPYTPPERDRLPIAIQTVSYLHYPSVYLGHLRAHLDQPIGQLYRRRTLLKLAALLHDIAKPQTKQHKPDGSISFHEHQTIGGEIAHDIALRLGLPEEAASYIRRIVRGHMRPGQLAELETITLRSVQRFFKATGDAGPDLLLHALADHLATRGPHLNVSAWYVQVHWYDELLDMIWGEEVEPIQPLINGHVLMQELGLPPGPHMGQLLAAIGEAQAGGDITTAEEALALARTLLERLR